MKDRPFEKRRVTLAHEYAHLLADRDAAGIDCFAPPGRKPANERFAEAFAFALLMPAAAVRARFHRSVQATGGFQVAELVKLKREFGVSFEAMALRLESLGLLRAGTWDMLREERVKVRSAERELGFVPESSDEPSFPERYRLLAVQAYESGELTEKELANYLLCDVYEARRAVADATRCAELDAEGRPLPMQPEFQRSLLERGA